MADLTVIIPARKEKYLNKTILDIQKKSKAEIVVVLDGENAERLAGVNYIYNEKPKGMRTAINQAVATANGKYIMKLDAHCMLDNGLDEKLITEHQFNWVQIPRRKRLNPVKWEITDNDKPDVDYMYINKNDLRGYKCNGKNRDPELKNKLIDDTETFQGSCWFMEKAYFNKLGLLDDKNFAGMGHESNEIVFKVLQDGGRIVVNKKTWYAHWHKTKTEVNFGANKSKSRKYIFELAKQTNYK